MPSLPIPIPIFMQPYPFPLEPPPYTNIDWKGKRKARQEEEEVYLPFSSMYIAGTSSVSLSRLQEQFDMPAMVSSSLQLRLLLWLLDQSTSPTNDVKKRGRRWHVNAYLRAELEQRQKIYNQPAILATSIDILCAELLKKEVRLKMDERDLQLLKIISSRALQRRAHRTMRALEEKLKFEGKSDTMEPAEDHLSFLLTMQERFLIDQARQGNWEAIWTQRDQILHLLKRQKRLGILQQDDEDKWQLDVVLLRSLHAHCAQYHALQNKDVFPERKIDLTGDTYYFEHLKTLQQQMREVYGQINDRWLINMVIGVARGMEPGLHGRHRALSLTNYTLRRPLIHLAQELFAEHCSRSTDKITSSSIELKSAMLGLELNLVYHCRSNKVPVERERMLQQAEKHKDKVRMISTMLASDERRASREGIDKALEYRLQVMTTLESNAMATYLSVRLSLQSNEWKTALDNFQTLLDKVSPDEIYHGLLNDKASRVDRLKSTARAMMATRRLMRGALICVAVQLDNGSLKDKEQGIPVLLQVARDSVEKGVWDPWPLRNRDTCKSLKLLKFQAHLLDPPADFASLLLRLLGMCRPAVPVHRNRAQEGYHIVQDGYLATTFWTVMEQLPHMQEAMKKRIDFLSREGLLLLPNEDVRSRNSMRDIFVNRGSSAAQCIWALFADQKEKDLMIPRMKLLLDKIFLPLGLQQSGWTSARKAMEQRWPPYADTAEVKQDLWALFEEAAHKNLQARSRLAESDAIVSPPSTLARINQEKRSKRKERKRIFSETGLRPIRRSRWA